MENFENLSHKERVQILKDLQKQHKEISNEEKAGLISACPYCNYEKVQRNGRRANGTQMFLCPNCLKSFSENTGTCFHNVKQKDKMRQCIQLMAGGYLPVNEMAEALGISVMTAINWRHKILKALPEGKGYIQTMEVPEYHKGKRNLQKKGKKKRTELSFVLVNDKDAEKGQAIQEEFREWMQTQMKGVSGKYIHHYAAWFRLISENVTPVQVDEILEKVMVAKV